MTEKSPEKSKIKKHDPPSRQGKEAFTLWYLPDMKKRLSHLAVDLGRSKNDLILEGIEHVLNKYSKE